MMKFSTVAVLALLVAGSQAAVSNGNSGSQRTPATPPPTGRSYGGVTPEVRAHVDLVNQYRAKHGLGPVCINENLQKAAEYHANEQLRRKDMGHETSYGSPWNRAKAYGYGSAAAENVAMNIIAPEAEQQKKCRDPVGNYFPKIRDTVESAKYASCQLYNSEGHRVNMLKPDVNQIGYGFATNGRDSYHTEMYGRSDQPCVSNYGNPGYPSNPQPKAPEQQPKRPEQPKTPQQPRAPYKQPEVPRKETPAQPPKQEYTPTPPPPTPTRPPRQAYTPVRQPYTPPKQEYKPDSPQRPSTPYTPETPKESPKVPTYSYGTPDVPAKKKKRVCVRRKQTYSTPSTPTSTVPAEAEETTPADSYYNGSQPHEQPTQGPSYGYY